ncbi:hypothetical protein GCM10025734_04210 [Kitasatospora paranensis]
MAVLAEAAPVIWTASQDEPGDLHGWLVVCGAGLAVALLPSLTSLRAGNDDLAPDMFACEVRHRLRGLGERVGGADLHPQPPVGRAGG